MRECSISWFRTDHGYLVCVAAHVFTLQLYEEHPEASLHPFHVFLTNKADGRSIFRVLEPICGARRAALWSVAKTG